MGVKQRSPAHRQRARRSTPGWIRTNDLRIRSPLLYPLSYRGRCGREARDRDLPIPRPTTAAFPRGRERDPFAAHRDDPIIATAKPVPTGAVTMPAPGRAPDHSSSPSATRTASRRTRGLRLYTYDILCTVHDMPLDTTHSVSEARKHLSSIIDRVRNEHTPIYLARRGRRVAALIDADDLDEIIELAEDMADIRAADAARADMQATGEAPIPWEQAKADLGLT